MRSAARRSLAVTAAVLAASAGIAQVPAGSPRLGAPVVETPAEVPGYIATVQVEAIARDLKPTAATAPEAQTMLGRLKAPTSVVSTFYLAQDLSRQEIVSTDFVLPAGTVLLHRAGDKAYVIADPGTKTYAVMDAETLLAALEGGAGIVKASMRPRSCTPTTARRSPACWPARAS